MSVSGVAMVLAAGHGERMRPLTAARAKPALPVLGVPLVGRIVRQLVERGVRRVAVNAFHAPETIREAVEHAATGGAAHRLFVETTLMGTGGALAAPAAELRAHDRFLLHNGDTLVELPVARLAAAAEGPRRLGALLARPGATRGYGAIAVRDGQLVGLAGELGAPDGWTEATYLGVGMLRREVLDAVPPDRPSDLFRDVLLPQLARGFSLAVVETTGRWLEFTSPDSYRAHLVSLALRQVSPPGGDGRFARYGPAAIHRGDGARVAAGAWLDGGVVLEADAVISRGATVSDSVLLEGAVVHGGALLRRVVVDRGTAVPAGAVFLDGVLTQGAAGEPAFAPFAEAEPR